MSNYTINIMYPHGDHGHPTIYVRPNDGCAPAARRGFRPGEDVAAWIGEAVLTFEADYVDEHSDKPLVVSRPMPWGYGHPTATAAEIARLAPVEVDDVIVEPSPPRPGE